MKQKLLYFFIAALITVACSSCGSGSGTTDANNSGSHPTPTGNKASGTVTLSVHVGGSGNYDDGNGTTEMKSEQSSALLQFTLPVVVSSSGISKIFQWQPQQWGGKADVAIYHQITFPCNSATATNFDTITRHYDTQTGGMQPGGATLSITNTGTYGITLAATSTGTPTTQFTSNLANCQGSVYTSNTGQVAGVPFQVYFTPFTNGAIGSVTGTIDASNPNHLTGSFDGTDKEVLFSVGTTVVSTPLTYVITWDITLTD